jgi:hypothetical protein
MFSHMSFSLKITIPYVCPRYSKTPLINYLPGSLLKNLLCEAMKNLHFFLKGQLHEILDPRFFLPIKGPDSRAKAASHTASYSPR